jgi:hypothetical protein
MPLLQRESRSATFLSSSFKAAGRKLNNSHLQVKTSMKLAG